MENKIKESLKLSPYEYFKYCNRKRTIRGLAVITDKQSIFYSQILNNDYAIHYEMEINIENEIHPNNKRYGNDVYYKNHVYIASLGKELVISMPENGELSLSQAKFISDILEQVDKYNNEKENNAPNIKIDLFESENHTSLFDIKDINQLKQKLKERVTKNITIEEEKIIGNTLTKEEIKIIY